MLGVFYGKYCNYENRLGKRLIKQILNMFMIKHRDKWSAYGEVLLEFAQ